MDGKDKSVEDFIPEYDPTARKKEFGRHLRPTEIACSLSHLRTLKIAYESGHDRVVVMEDDIVFSQYFMQTMNILSTLDESFECVRLYCGNKHKMNPVYIKGDITISRLFRATIGAQAYYINRTGMEKALVNSTPIQWPWDKYIFGYWRTQMRVFATEPNVVLCEDPTKVPSTINYNEKDSYNTLMDHWARMSHQTIDECNAICYRLKHFKDFYGNHV